MNIRHKNLECEKTCGIEIQSLLHQGSNRKGQITKGARIQSREDPGSFLENANLKRSGREGDKQEEGCRLCHPVS
jgi:hypothetical protein